MTDIQSHAAYRAALSLRSEETTPSEGVNIQAQPGAVSMNTDGTTTISRPMGLNTADLAGPGEGILSTARTKTGSPRMGPVEPTDIVQIEGRECQVQIAEGLGILKRDAQGNYTEVPGGLEALSRRSLRKPLLRPMAKPWLTPRSKNLSNLVGSVSAGLQVSALLQIIESGAATPNTISAAASEARIEPSAMNERVQNVMDAFRAQAVSTVQGFGSEDPEPFFDWAKQHKAAEFKKAMTDHGMERSTRGYEPIYREYVKSVAVREPSRVLNAQFG